MSMVPLLLAGTWVLSTLGQYINVHINVSDTSPIARIDSKFVGITIDSSLMPTPRAWGGLNFRSEKVQLLARGLSPSYLRLGGYLGDKLTFDPTGQGDPDLTFTASTWDAINQFAENVGWDIIFGLNDLTSRKDGQWDQTNTVELLQYTSDKNYKLAGVELGNGATHWKGLERSTFPEFPALHRRNSPSFQLRKGVKRSSLPEFSAGNSGKDDFSKPFPSWNDDVFLLCCILGATMFHLFVLSGVTEPRAFPSAANITGTQLGKDFFKLKTLLSRLPEYNSTLVVGPDIAAVTYTAAANYFSDFLTGGGSKAVDKITLHHYFCTEKTATISMFFDLDGMDFVRTEIEAARNLSKSTNPTTPIWLGETSSCTPGGAPGLSDTYVSGFRWLDELGLAASTGAEAVLRQDFYYGYYALLKQNTFDPLPDYWLTLLYKRLVGSPVLKAASDSLYFRTYAHCTRKDNPYGYIPGSVVIYIVAINDDVVKLSIPQFKKQSVHVFWLEPLGNLTSQTVTLNGLPLELANNTFPGLSPFEVTEDKLYLPGKTFGFLVIPNADLAVCKPWGKTY